LVFRAVLALGLGTHTGHRHDEVAARCASVDLMIGSDQAHGGSAELPDDVRHVIDAAAEPDRSPVCG